MTEITEMFDITSPGKPTIRKDIYTVDTLLRMAFGDSPSTTAKMMALNEGKPLTFKFKGMSLTCTKVTQ